MLDKIEIQFKTADEARAALEFLQLEGLRIDKATIRKSLPDFKGHINRNMSLWIVPFSEGDSILIRRRARTRTMGNV